MSDEDKALVERVAMLPDGNAWPSTVELLCDLRDRIEAQAAEIEKLEKAIKVQASAVRTLQANEGTEINVLRQQKREWHQAVLSLDSEREANAILTAEIEKLREAGNELGGYAGHDDSCDCVKGWAKGPCNCGYTETWNQWRAALGETE